MNKLKGSLNALKMKYILTAFGVSLVASIALRTYHLLALVDSSTGFFVNSDATVPIFYGVVAVCGLAFLVMSFLCGGVPSPKSIVGKNYVLAIGSLVATGGFIWDTVTVVNENLPQFNGNINIFINLLSSNIKENGGTFVVLQAVFALFSVVYCIVYAISHLNGSDSYKKFKTLALSPLFWAMSLLVSRLMQATSFIKVSEILLEIFMCVFMMLFFFTFARISSGVFTENSMWGIYGYGFTAVLFGSVVTVPRLIVMAVGLSPVSGNEFSVAHLTGIVFILVYILSTLGVGFKDGIANRKTVNELDLPDDNVAVTKKETEVDTDM